MKEAVRWSSHLYRFLIRAYPSAFASDFRDEMVWCFEDMCSAAIDKNGLWGLTVLWMRVAPDWCFTVIKEHLLKVGYQGATTMDYTDFNTQLTSTLALFTRALRSGYSVKQACEIITQYAPEPTKSVFQNLLDKVEAGTGFGEAMEEISGELKSSEFDRILAAMNKQRQEGGNLADKLDDLNRDIYTSLGDTGWAKEIDLEDGYVIAEHYPLN